MEGQAIPSVEGAQLVVVPLLVPVSVRQQSTPVVEGAGDGWELLTALGPFCSVCLSVRSTVGW